MKLLTMVVLSTIFSLTLATTHLNAFDMHACITNCELHNSLMSDHDRTKINCATYCNKRDTRSEPKASKASGER